MSIHSQKGLFWNIYSLRLTKESYRKVQKKRKKLGLDDEKLKELSEKQAEFVSKMVDLYGFNKRVSIKELKEKGFYSEFIDSCYWIIERYDFAVRFIKDFKEKREMKSDTYQAILDSF